MNKWMVVGVSVLLAGAIAIAFDIPRFAWGILTYGKQRRTGSLLEGHTAPSARVHELPSGTERNLSDWFGEKPLVLIFGSCT